MLFKSEQQGNFNNALIRMTEVKRMSEKEKKVIEKLAESIEKLDPLQKEYFSGLADGMALAQQRQEAAEKMATAET